MRDVDPTASTAVRRRDHLLQMIWRRRGLVLGAAVAGLAAAMTAVQLATPAYTSLSEIYYQQNAAQLLDDSMSLQAGVGEKFLATEARVIQSPAVLAVALDAMEQAGFTFSSDEDPLIMLQRGVEVELSRSDDILRVRFTAPDPNEAQVVVRHLVDAYQTFQKTKRQQTLETLTEERARILRELRAKSEELIAFKQQHGTLTFEDDRDNLIIQRLASLYEAMTAAHVEAINAKTAYEEAASVLANDPELLKRVEAIRESGMVTSVADQATLRMELFNLQQRLSDAKRQYMSGHPIIHTIQGRIDELSVAYVGASREHWLAAERRQADLERSYKEQQKLALTMQSRRQEFAQLNDELGELQKLVADMGSQYNRLTLMESVGQLNLTVLRPATLPGKPSWPDVPRMLGLGLAGGLLLGLGGGLLLEWRNQRLRSADEVKHALGVPVLGVIPAMRRDRSPAHRGMKAHIDSTSDVAEAYRAACTAVQFGLADGYSKTILITSPNAGDGKSTFVANLAITMARAGRRVLIIDANLRMPFQHRIFSVGAADGLATVLAGGEPGAAIVKTSIDNLELLPCGAAPEHPADMLNSQSFSDLLGDLAAKYDHVLLDAPALMGVPDARIAAAWCDATLLVLHAERTNRKVAELAREGLVAVGANLLGIIVNDVDAQSGQHHFASDLAVSPLTESASADDTALPAAALAVADVDAPAAGAQRSTPAPRPREAAVVVPPRPKLVAARSAAAPVVPTRPAPVTGRQRGTDAPANSELAHTPFEVKEPIAPAPTAPAAAEPVVGEPAAAAAASASSAFSPAATTPAAPTPDRSPASDDSAPTPTVEPSINDKLAETSAKLRRSYVALRSGSDR